MDVISSDSPNIIGRSDICDECPLFLNKRLKLQIFEFLNI